MKYPPLVLPRVARIMVDAVMRKHGQIREWDLRALSVRSNHVHVVIANPEVRPEMMVKQLKEWGTQKLRSHRMIGAGQVAWADHASTIYLFEPGVLEAKVKYLMEKQDDPPEGHGRDGWEEAYGLKRP